MSALDVVKRILVDVVVRARPDAVEITFCKNVLQHCLIELADVVVRTRRVVVRTRRSRNKIKYDCALEAAVLLVDVAASLRRCVEVARRRNTWRSMTNGRRKKKKM